MTMSTMHFSQQECSPWYMSPACALQLIRVLFVAPDASSTAVSMCGEARTDVFVLLLCLLPLIFLSSALPLPD